jgi:HlyD family secretion protein
MMMRVLKTIVITLVLCSVSIASLSCAGESEPAAEYQLATVQRGNLTVDIAASGNLALSVVEDLAFEISGTVEEILVEEGESVEEGQLLAKLDTSEWEEELVTLERSLLEAEINLKNAELALEKAEDETSTTITGDIATTTTDPEEIEILELKVELAEARYEDAKEALEEALNASPEIIAPFAGFIINVNVQGGDEVLKGTVAVTLADPDKFESEILVSEMDIYQVEVGGAATVVADAFSGVTIPATVTYISPTATISSGVVNYSVTVELQSLEAATVVADGTQSPPEGFTPPEGSEPPEGFEIPEGFEPPEGFNPTEGQTSITSLEDFQLREGLTVSVSIIVAERTDVLLVPNGAITSWGQQTYVQVMLEDGTIEERVVTTGISNWQYTEVTDGLSEGEQVVVPQGTAATTTPQQEFPSEFFIPGMGGPQ